MYAAAGGASLASRQARKKQAAQNTKNKATNQQILREKLAAKAVTTPTKSKPFHQLPASYLRAPHQHHRKLSAGYTTVPGFDQHQKSLVPISEQSSSSHGAHPPHTPHHHHHHHHHHPGHPGPCYAVHGPSGGSAGASATAAAAHPPFPKPTGFREYDKLVRRQQLTKSATATLPLVSQAQDLTPPQTPTATLCFADQQHQRSTLHLASPNPNTFSQPLHLQIPTNDPIIITPATPQATPPGKLNLQLTTTTTTATADDEGRPLTPTPGALERKCSVYRSRSRHDPFEEHLPFNQTTISSSHHEAAVYYAQHQLPNGDQQQTYVCKWDTEYYCCDAEHRQLGVCTCDHIECAQGRAAWLERGRRCSVQETPASCHRRWVKRNRIQDSSVGGSSDDEDLLGVLRGPSSFANAFLYVGLGTIAIGLVIAFVGTGEKGFKTVELRLIGPSLIGLGLFCCILRILFCICPSHCLSSSRKARNKKNAKIDADHRTSLLRGDSKRVSIARGPHIPTKQPQIYPKSIVKTKTYEGVEALRQIATTSLFLQNEQKVSSNRIVPIIKEPEKGEEPPLELKKINSLKADTLSVIDIVSISDGEDDAEDDRSHKHHPQAGKVSDTQVIDLTGEDDHSHPVDSHHQRKDSKLRRQRTSVNQQKSDPGASSLSPPGGSGASSGGGSLLMETSLMIIGPTPVTSPTKPMQQSTLTVPMTTPLDGAPRSSAGSGSLLTVLPTQSTSSTSAFGAIVAPSINNNHTQVPGSLSPLPSTSYQPSAAALMSHISPLTSPHNISGLTHNSSSSSSSYLLSPPPVGGSHLGASALSSPSPNQYDPLTLGTNTVTTTSPLLQSPPSAATTTKNEPELVLSPAKLGQ
ncbi:uncharacterized protein LOC5564192 isoform X1 [Aedes aegypti]|uniref:Uncharacterized protein n=1 Tax=Aedes aegypti TaxID=7159 RepID=A0A6I8TPR4_AEDAE|nr:uncharacterized protein LOC5564192 isoform X1 [Aedes aegypti]XP_021701623.1 uncharacterized protein LOC5564192 isoform X1 [Aedes aegypti]XP_021701624.1 uncharacterized protein LOC5564192 isoform X1 [Aedes aegypti]